MNKIAVIRIRGGINVKTGIMRTFEVLRLYKKNCCVVVDSSPESIGMIKKAKDYVTWGEIDEETFKLLAEKRGEIYKGREKDSHGRIEYKKFIVIDNKKYKKFFRLQPPKGGFERKGIKIPFSIGGALGYRGDKINVLIKKMI